MHVVCLNAYTSKPYPLYIPTAEDLLEAWFEKQEPIGRRFSVVVGSCLVTVVLLFSIAFLILFISNYYQAKHLDTKNDYM